MIVFVVASAINGFGVAVHGVMTSKPSEEQLRELITRPRQYGLPSLHHLPGYVATQVIELEVDADLVTR